MSLSKGFCFAMAKKDAATVEQEVDADFGKDLIPLWDGVEPEKCWLEKR